MICDSRTLQRHEQADTDRRAYPLILTVISV
jgi:hypothetical protein